MQDWLGNLPFNGGSKAIVDPPPGGLREDEVHVWQAPLQLADAALEALYATLSPDEKSRAEQFKFGADCRRFIARRGILRSILAKYTGIDPSNVRLQYTDLGKPGTAPDQGPRIRFSQSHSQWQALYAVTLDRDVGIDVEVIARSIPWHDISRVFFTECEQDAISRLAADRQPELFFELWTRKESILKALGMGLRFDPAHMDVAEGYAPGKANTLRRGDCLWTLQPLSADGFAATVTAAGAGWRVQRYSWPQGCAQP